jgi:hypothetical protein
MAMRASMSMQIIAMMRAIEFREGIRPHSVYVVVPLTEGAVSGGRGVRK